MSRTPRYLGNRLTDGGEVSTCDILKKYANLVIAGITIGLFSANNRLEYHMVIVYSDLVFT
jgi:hypothetical protein